LPVATNVSGEATLSQGRGYFIVKRAQLFSDVTNNIFKREDILMGVRIFNGVGRFFMVEANF